MVSGRPIRHSAMMSGSWDLPLPRSPSWDSDLLVPPSTNPFSGLSLDASHIDVQFFTRWSLLQNWEEEKTSLMLGGCSHS